MSRCRALKGSFVTLAVLSLFIVLACQICNALDHITIFTNSKCEGEQRYSLLVDRGRCIDLPSWIYESPDISINPEGYCIRMFPTNNCKVSILRGTKRPVEFNSCKTPAQAGLSSFKSFVIVPC